MLDFGMDDEVTQPSLATQGDRRIEQLEARLWHSERAVVMWETQARSLGTQLRLARAALRRAVALRHQAEGQALSWKLRAASMERAQTRIQRVVTRLSRMFGG